ncbi:MAG: Kazal-type serine protease inhibitor [Saprospiraceae bacterium]
MKPLSIVFILFFSIFVSATTKAHQGFFFTQDSLQLSLPHLEVNDTIFYEPVCGSNGKTYINAEMAREAGIQDWQLGSCADYETMQSALPGALWISQVEVNELSHSSAFEQEGYANFTNVIFELFTKQENDISLSSELASVDCPVQWTIWIDFNENRQFEEAERVLQAVSQDTQMQFELPEGIAIDYITRMRICLTPMQATMDSGILEMGEVEDYAVYITK